MRARHMVTLGIGIGAAAGLAAFAGCGTDTFGTCADTKSCGDDGSADGTSTSDQHVGGEGGLDGAKPTEGGGDAPHETGITCDAATAIVCNGECVDKATDPGNCGACGHTCGGPEAGAGKGVCVNGSCALACDEPDGGSAPDGGGVMACSGACVDTTSDPTNCKSCGNVCPGPDAGSGKAICLNSVCNISCVSDAGTTLFCPLTNTCVDPTTIANCGGCGNVCTARPRPTARRHASRPSAASRALRASTRRRWSRVQRDVPARQRRPLDGSVRRRRRVRDLRLAHGRRRDGRRDEGEAVRHHRRRDGQGRHRREARLRVRDVHR